MSYRIARKHVRRLHNLALLFAFGGVHRRQPPHPGAVTAAAMLAALSMVAGFLIERWLFFAEAEHVVMLYYGADVA